MSVDVVFIKVRSLKQKNGMEIEKFQKNVREATSLAVLESSKHKTTREFFKSTVDQVFFCSINSKVIFDIEDLSKFIFIAPNRDK